MARSTLPRRDVRRLALDSAAGLIRAHLEVGGKLPQSAFEPVEWAYESAEYAAIARELGRLADQLEGRAGRLEGAR